MLETITAQAKAAAEQLLAAAKLSTGDIVVVGCSTSEVGGHAIGTDSVLEVAEAVFDGLYPVLQRAGVYLAAQCCEHLNRALIVEREAARLHGLEPVNAVPQPKAGGSFATTAYRRFVRPVAVETVDARARHGLRHAAVPAGGGQAAAGGGDRHRVGASLRPGQGLHESPHEPGHGGLENAGLRDGFPGRHAPAV